MSGIVLSASVRQNLLSLQSTASLLATTQNDLSTGNKVNTALDNPTEYFTAQGLNNRASDISNLLDGIGNGVQVLQAANTGITSLQSLVASAQSIANQVLQSPVGYSTKSNVTSVAINGATAQNLLGTGTGYADATVVGTAATATTTAAYTSAAATAGTVLTDSKTTSATSVSAASLLSGGTTAIDAISTALTTADNLIVNGKTITFNTTATTGTATGGNLSIDIATGTVGDILAAVDAITGNTTNASTVTGAGAIQFNTGTNANLTITGSTNALTALGLGSGVTANRGGGAVTTPSLTSGTLLAGVATGAGALTSQFTTGDTISVDGKTIAFYDSGAGGAAGTAANTTYLDLHTATVNSLLGAIDTDTGGTGSAVAGGVVTLHTGITNDLSITSSNTAALAALGLGSTAITKDRGGAQSGLSGETLTIGATGDGTATSITFGTGANQISTLNELNTALAANNLQATIDPTGVLTLTTSNNAASSTIGTIGGSAAGTAQAFAAFNGVTGPEAVADPNAQATRTGLISQYNNILQQIDTTSQDSSFNGINLLEGDTLNLTFDETGKSTLAIAGVTFNTAGLGLSTLTAGTDFLDSNSANNVLASLTNVSSTLRSEASNLGSNLSIVQIRQDFSKNLIDVLQTGASNLTLADTNEEAANSQALSTRQSIAVSALALANSSQQSVLQLLR